ncbi:penicillin-insensitive murein endopeptidase [Nereida sp. MMG025]|uniref:penicillin-insensitive murein endopeptidase n=1 Tax=Nereida sp. MMG025 TaxID=2909981 RepID=UPI001F01425D|nr:penicillin-insensitive murein endopeptidase [Nereida sp. MMG025]MCF6444715.1 penicillin-insensitive murein endopeptidase [Nereida sp. MMG025]
MERILGFLVLTFALATCGQADRDISGEMIKAPTLTAQERNTLAKVQFGAARTPTQGASQAIGGYAKGCLAGAEQLAQTGPTWQAMRLSRGRNWAHPETIDFVKKLSRFAATQDGWQGLYVGDMAQPRGGPMLTGHRSHQTGLGVDIWMLPPKRLNLTENERENISSISMRRNAGAFTNSKWTQQHMNILRAAAKDPRTARIFVFPGAKVAMCNAEKGDRSYLRKIRPWWGHHYHFHVRLECPKGSPNCISQDAPPRGDGCADAQDWVNNILNPPPPDPNAPPPRKRRELTLTDLPAQCTTVLRGG